MISAGAAGILAGHPLDTAKVRIQTQPPQTGEGAKLYRSTLHCLRSIVKTEGASSRNMR